MKYIDLSHEIKNNMPVYPGDIDVNLTKEKDFNKDGYNMYSLYKDNKKFISEYPIEKFIGNVALLDVRGEKIIELKDEYYKNIKENDIVILFTGWDNFYGKEEYYTKHPIVSMELAELLIKKKVKMVGMDMPSPDRNNYEIHNALFENDIFLLENLTNLNKLLYNEKIKLFAQPLKIESESSLVRAIASYEGY